MSARVDGLVQLIRVLENLRDINKNERNSRFPCSENAPIVFSDFRLESKFCKTILIIVDCLKTICWG